MSEQAEIDLHREQIAKKSALLEELETSNNAGSDVFPGTQAEIDRLKAQVEQSGGLRKGQPGKKLDRARSGCCPNTDARGGESKWLKTSIAWIRL